MRWVAAVLLVILLVLQYQLWVADGGIRDAWSLHKELEAQVEENRRLEERNAALAAEVEDLKRGLAEVEERARAELGMIKDGEVFYQVVEVPDDEERDGDR